MLLALDKQEAKDNKRGFDVAATVEQQVFETTGYPNGYPFNTDCEWNFCAPSGNQVELVILEGKLRSCDQLQVNYY